MFADECRGCARARAQADQHRQHRRHGLKWLSAGATVPSPARSCLRSGGLNPQAHPERSHQLASTRRSLAGSSAQQVLRTHRRWGVGWKAAGSVAAAESGEPCADGGGEKAAATAETLHRGRARAVRRGAARRRGSRGLRARAQADQHRQHRRHGLKWLNAGATVPSPARSCLRSGGLNPQAHPERSYQLASTRASGAQAEHDEPPRPSDFEAPRSNVWS